MKYVVKNNLVTCDWKSLGKYLSGTDRINHGDISEIQGCVRIGCLF